MAGAASPSLAPLLPPDKKSLTPLGMLPRAVKPLQLQRHVRRHNKCEKEARKHEARSKREGGGGV